MHACHKLDLSASGPSLGRAVVVLCLLASACVLNAATCSPPPAGLVSWWRAEGDATDFVGANNGTLEAGTVFVPGEVGQAFEFQAPGSGVDVGMPTNLELQDFTIETWVKRTSPNTAGLDGFSFGSVVSWAWGGFAVGMFDSGQLFLAKVGYSSVSPSLAIADAETFHHLAVTKSGSNVVFYLDGVAESVAGFDPGFVFNGTLAIGTRGSDHVTSFNGVVDEPSIYNRALSNSEIQAIYAAGIAGKCTTAIHPVCAPVSPGLVAWWQAESNGWDTIGGHDGVLLNGVSFAAAEAGQGFSLNGLNSHVRVADSAALHLTNALTIEGWIYPASSGTYQQLVSKWDVLGSTHQKSYTTALNPTGHAYLTVCPTGDDSTGSFATVASTNSAPLDEWTRFAASYDGSALRIYLNGVCESSNSYTQGIFPGVDDLGIGGTVGGVPPDNSPVRSLA